MDERKSMENPKYQQTEWNDAERSYITAKWNLFQEHKAGLVFEN
jgi:hypothetical protein